MNQETKISVQVMTIEKQREGKKNNNATKL